MENINIKLETLSDEIMNENKIATGDCRFSESTLTGWHMRKKRSWDRYIYIYIRTPDEYEINIENTASNKDFQNFLHYLYYFCHMLEIRAYKCNTVCRICVSMSNTWQIRYGFCVDFYHLRNSNSQYSSMFIFHIAHIVIDSQIVRKNVCI